jgi:hypothetical protein
MQTLVTICIGIVILLGAYFFWIRPWQLSWGATKEEVELTLPGDDIVKKPNFISTRAIDISVKPEKVWPWIVQIGCSRAGFYSYDWIDNAGKPSANQIIPDLQHIAVGDFIPMTPDNKNGLWIKEFKQHEYILWWDQKGNAS